MKGRKEGKYSGMIQSSEGVSAWIDEEMGIRGEEVKEDEIRYTCTYVLIQCRSIEKKEKTKGEE